MQVLLIGCGAMGGALLEKWVEDEEATFTIVDPHLVDAPSGATLHSDRQHLNADKFDAIIVAIKPQLIKRVLPDYRDSLHADGFVASIAAGCSVQRLQSAMGQVPVIRIMPNLPAKIGKGVSGLFASEDVRPEHRSFVERLMQLAGTSVWVEQEDGLDRITAIAGSGPGYIFEIANAYVNAAEQLGFSASDARALVLWTMSGTIEMAQSASHSLEQLRDSVTSKNGTTQAGLAALNGEGALSALLKETTQAAYQRAIELR